MSIIYDALQKTQQSRNNRFSWLGYFFVTAFIASLSVVVTIVIMHKGPLIHLNDFSVTQKTQMHNPVLETPGVAKRNFKTSHALNGVYLSENENVALINNTFFHLGDDVDGFKLMSIETDQIKFRTRDNHLLVLKMGETV